MRRPESGAGSFVVSLDYELMWGVRDHATRETYGRNILGGREAILALLDLFHRRGIRATWAIVGALLCESKSELMQRARQALVSRAVLNSFHDIGPSERRDPYHFGASLARRIASCEGQEIGTHTFSHRCALEPGVTLEYFGADVSQAVLQLREWGIRCRSIVFPRNQYNLSVLEACGLMGITHFRGNEKTWFYAPASGDKQTKPRRLCRLADSYINLSGSNVSRPAEQNSRLVNVASSRFLRPFNARLAPLESLRLNRIEKAMQDAALTGGTFHLWWHPENFGTHLAENLRVLNKVLDAFDRFRNEHGMQSRVMNGISAGEPAIQAPCAGQAN
jgi:hypothetical protein